LADASGLVITLETTPANQRASSNQEMAQSRFYPIVFSKKFAGISPIFNQKTETQFNWYSGNTQ